MTETSISRFSDIEWTKGVNYRVSTISSSQTINCEISRVHSIMFLFSVPPAKPDYINEKEVTSTTVSLTWPDASWQDTREYSYRVFYKRQGEPRYRISPSEPYLDRDYYGMNIVVNVTGLEPGSTYYFEVQSVTNTPEEGPRYSDEVVIEVLTKGESRQEHQLQLNFPMVQLIHWRWNKMATVLQTFLKLL